MLNSQDLRVVPEASEVRAELSRVLSSTVFRGSKRCQDFLQFVVTKVLEGDAETLKERTLAVDVFGRDAAGDLGDDNIVRVGARDVRKLLAQYYVADGAHDPIRIDLPAGSYVAVFQYHTKIDQPLLAPPIAPAQEQPASPPAARRFSLKSMGRLKWLVAAVVAVAALSVVSWRMLHHLRTEFDVFWQPAFTQKTPLPVLLAHPIVYHPSSHATELNERRNGKSSLPVQIPINVPANLLDGSDFVPVIDQYVGFSDAAAALPLAALLVQHGGSTRVRLASKVEFNDLVGTGAILIGAFTNRWTVQLTQRFRFQFAYQDGKPCIVDTATGRRFLLTTKTDNGQSAEDYILVCRLPHSRTNGFVVICAGLNFYGTEEAGRILTDPDLLNPILRKLPKDWPDRNLQLVLHVEVVGGAPALPEVVSVHTW